MTPTTLASTGPVVFAQTTATTNAGAAGFGFVVACVAVAVAALLSRRRR